MEAVGRIDLIRSILFVCTANVCRSPTAEGVFGKLLVSKPGLNIEVASAGTTASHVGMPAFPMAVTAARKRGYDITTHIARVLVPVDFERFDLILGMDRENVKRMNMSVPTRLKDKIELFLGYGDHYYGMEVPDPYGGQERHFEEALDRIEDGCKGLMKLLVR